MNTLKLLPLAVLFFAGCAVHAEPPLCFESDKLDIANQTPWSHQYFVLDLAPTLFGPEGRKFRGVTGYGFNMAGDVVPLTGTAVQDKEQWVVSILGTLHQQSTYLVVDKVPEIRYWIISQNWELGTGPEFIGNSHQGNLIQPFGHQFPVTHDDSFDSFIQRIPCEEVPK